MDASRVTQSLDSLWFYTNVLTCRHHPLPSLTHQKSDSDIPNSPLLLNLQNECEIVESETEKKDRGRRRRRRTKRRSQSEPNAVRKIHGGVDLGFHVKVLAGSFKFELQTRKLPYHDDMAMKEHLKSWAYAVACTVTEMKAI